MRLFQLCLIYLVFSFLCGCDGTEMIHLEPAATFDPFPVRHPRNLERVLGSRVRLEAQGDTLDLRIRFNRATGLNLITQAQSSDTLLKVWVLRHRRLYYFVEPHPGPVYWVYAVRIRQGRVQGLDGGWQQMFELGRYVREGQLAELVRFRSSQPDSFRLRFDARHLHDFYAAQADSMPSFRIVRPVSVARPVAAAPAATFRLYPNPASAQVTAAFDSAAARTARLYDSNGKLLREWPVAALENRFSVADQPAGVYLLRVIGPGQSVLTQRLVVQH